MDRFLQRLHYFPLITLGFNQKSLLGSFSVDDGVVVHYQESPRPLPPNRIYKREYLLMRANSPLCQRPPPNYESVQQKVPEIIRKVSV